MSQAQSFPLVSRHDARVLILGSMPGQISLQKQHYYAHPRNGFWSIMAEMLGFDASAPYASRLDILTQNKIALWDVLQCCFRPGSLDSAIDETSIVVNDFVTFFKAHPSVRAVFFNGAKAEQLFEKHVVPQLGDIQEAIFMMRLPSTSPANAQMSLSDKAQHWREVKVQLEAF